MSSSHQRYFPNNLQEVPLDERSLRHTLATLQEAIQVGIKECSSHATQPRSDRHDSFYTGESGVAMMHLRLATQSKQVGLPPDLDGMSLITHHLPTLHHHSLQAGHISPLDSPVGPALLELLRHLDAPSPPDTWYTALSTLKHATNIAAFSEDDLGGYEVLYGRAGLLWAMINLRERLFDNQGNQERRSELNPFVGDTIIQAVIAKIMDVGATEARSYKEQHGDPALPFMWEWHGKYYLGAIHGVAGILTTILQAPSDLVVPYLHRITATISGLISVARKYDGHLPSSLPAKNRSNAYVQMCHGSPGLLLLLATLRATYPSEWKQEWESGLAMSSDAVWEQGLVQKGLGICHGVTGNAWSWLLLARTEKNAAKKDQYISRALAFLLHATQLPPLKASQPLPGTYRTPDHPYSLFEGLAGAVCGWADACCLIKALLEGGDLAAEDVGMLGMPGMGGVGPTGLL